MSNMASAAAVWARMAEIDSRRDFVRAHIRRQTEELNSLQQDNHERRYQLELEIADYYEELISAYMKYDRLQNRLQVLNAA